MCPPALCPSRAWRSTCVAAALQIHFPALHARCAARSPTAKSSSRQIGSDGNIQAGNCGTCHSHVKVRCQPGDPVLDLAADDAALLGLDLLVREAGYRRGAANPCLPGY